MNVTHGPAFLLVALVPVVAGCGGGGAAEPPPSVSSATSGATAQRWDLDVTGRELMTLKRVGAGYGTSDVVKYGSDGSVAVIKMYGGGGNLLERCRLRAGELARLRHDLRALPLDPAPRVRERPRPTFYTPVPAQYTFTHDKRVETFTDDAMPADARPLVRRLVHTLDGRVATCRVVVRTRRA